MKKIASHNSLSSYRLKNWWFYPLALTSKCQTKTLKEQFDSGVRSFDLRIRQWYDDQWYGAHGLAVYDITFQSALAELAEFAKEDVIYFRVMVEDTFVKSSFDDAVVLVNSQLALHHNPNLKLLGINSKKDYNGYHINGNVDSIEYSSCWYFNNRADLAIKAVDIIETIADDAKEVCFTACYISRGIPALLGIPYPKLAAKVLRPIANMKHTLPNEMLVLDFV